MKVKELIKQLQAIDPELEVVTSYNKYGSRTLITGIDIGMLGLPADYFCSSKYDENDEEPTHVDLTHDDY